MLLSLAFFAGVVRADIGQLVVADARGEVLFSFPLAPEERWCLLWNHSVAGFTVSDCFVYRPPSMVLERSHQPDFAAGLGHTQGRGELTSDGAGGYWIEHIDQPLAHNTLNLRVGSSAVDHRIVHRELTTSISHAIAGQRVSIRLEPCGVRNRPSVRGEVDADE